VGFQFGLASIENRSTRLVVPISEPHVPVGWARAMDTPFQWTKQFAGYLGGIRNPMVATWPNRIKDRGGLRTQFHHVI
jgi:arylsulfatase A-like enzyme